MSSAASARGIDRGHGEQVWHLVDHGSLPGWVLFHAQVPAAEDLMDIGLLATMS